MKLNPPANENYAATIVTVRGTTTLPQCDNVVGVAVHGYQAIVSKDTQVGQLYILFTAETQLSTDYAHHNNLHRHENLNADPKQTGYLEDNRRIKAMRFRGNTSNALLMPLSSLEFTGVRLDYLKEGDTFDEFDGVPICRKYTIPTRGGVSNNQQQSKKIQRVDDSHFPRHFDTANYFRNSDQFNPYDQVTVTQKLHGTSVRIAHTIVKRKLTWKDKVAKYFGATVQETEYAYVYGSRNVVKDPGNPFAQPGFYAEDIYSQVGGRLKGSIPKGYVIYGEIIGWVGTTPIQPGFTYGLPVGESKLYVYRVAQVNPSGRAVDLTWDQVVGFCQEIGVDTVPEVHRGEHGEFSGMLDLFIDVRLKNRFSNALPTDGTVDEGVCVRREGLPTPLVLKAKSPKFFELESKQLDSGVPDMESQA